MTSTKFRIVTWNCNGGKFEKKYPYITELIPDPDITIIQEIAQPKIPIPNCIWTPSSTPTKGVAVTTRNGFSVMPHPIDPDAPIVFVPVIIRGPVEFHLLAVWTQKNGKYVDSFRNVFDRYHEFLHEKSSVIAGDFNSNAIWNHEHKIMNHSKVVEYCVRELGLVSSYHKKISADHGKEEHPTIYWQHNRAKPYHIDYCFVPESWEIDNVEIGTFDDWHDKSDHCPVIVDVSVNTEKSV